MSHPNHPPPGHHPAPGNPVAGYAYPPPPAGYAYPPPGYGAPPPGPHGALPPGYPPAPYGYAYPPPGYAHPPAAPTGYATAPPPHMPPGYGYPPATGYPNHPGVPPPPHGYAYPTHAYPPAPVPVAPHPVAAPVAHVPIATNPPTTSVATTPPKPTLATWNASSEDSAKINYWFTDLDKDSRGSIGGVEAVQFLKKSNLPKETLREIWNIVDSEKQGRLDRSKFLAAIRFLCILCNPMYAGSKPSIDLFNNTIHANLPIPVQLEATNEADVNPFAALEAAQTPVVASHSDAISASFPQTVVSAPLPELPPLAQPVYHNSQYPVSNFTPISNEEEEEFSDFAGAQSVPAMSSISLQPALTIPLPPVSTSTTVAAEEDDDFSDFQSTTPALTPPSHSLPQQAKEEEEDVFAGLSADIPPAPLATFAPSMISPQSANPPAVMVQDDDEDDDFEGFQEAVTPIASHDSSKIVEELVLPSSQITSAESNNSLSSMSTAQGIISSTTSPLGHTPISSMMQSSRNESNNRLSVFDELVESDLKVQAEEWDDFADAPQPATSLESQQKQEDDMIDLLAIDEEPVTVQLSLPTSAPQDEDFEFGDFEASPQPDQATSSVNISDQVDSKKESGLISDAEPVDDDFGDFENFQAPDPVTSSHNINQSTNISLVQPPVQDDFGDFGSFEESKPAEEVQEDNLLDFSMVQDSPIIVSSTTTSQPASSQVIDLLDLLADQPSFITPSPTQTNNNSFDPFAPAPVSVDANFAAFPEDNDFEADFQTAFDNNTPKPVEENKKQVQEPTPTLPQKLTIKKVGKSPVDKPTGKVVVTSSSSTSKTNKAVLPPHTKPLSVKELQHLSEMLFEKQFYDESYDAALQAYVLQNIQRLMEEQQRALENDDLETTMKIKQEADTFVSQMESLDAEQRWILKSKLPHKGQSLHDMFEAIGLFDPSYAAVFKEKYMKQLPKPHVSVNTLVQRVRHYALAKRSARMIVAIISSHQQHPTMWKQMLQHIEKMLMEGNNLLLSFSSLSSSDQKSIKQQESFVQYTKSLVQVCEVGMYVAASCFETYKHESEAKKVMTLAKEVLQLSKKEWGSNSTMLKMTWQDLSLLACKYSEQKNVVYCNITLRPMFQNKDKVNDDEESDDSSSKKKKIEIYPHYTSLDSSAFNSEVKNGNPTFYYMKPALNLWVHDISKSMPDADGEFI